MDESCMDAPAGGLFVLFFDKVVPGTQVILEAPSWRGPYRVVGSDQIDHCEFCEEDPFMWVDKRGHYHVLCEEDPSVSIACVDESCIAGPCICARFPTPPPTPSLRPMLAPNCARSSTTHPTSNPPPPNPPHLPRSLFI